MEKLEESRQNRLKEIKMEEILKEIMIYFFFVLILFFLSYQGRDKESFVYTENMKNMFLGNFESVSYLGFKKKYTRMMHFPAFFYNGSRPCICHGLAAKVYLPVISIRDRLLRPRRLF